MVKKMISRLSVLAVLTVFLAACSKTSEYTNAIPADATVIVSVDLQSLAEKSGLNDKENEALKQKLTESIKSGSSAAAFQQLEKVLQNPSELGIDFEAPLYFFTSNSFPYSAIVGKIGSADKVKTSFEAMIKEQLCQPLEEGDGYTYTLSKGNLIAFTPTTILLVNTSNASQVEEAKSAVANLFKQTTDNSISKQAGFLKMQKQKGDFTFLTSMAAIPDMMYTSQIASTLPATIAPKDIMLLGGMSFEKGKIAMQIETFTENKEAEALIKKQNKALKELNSSFLKLFPASTLAFFSMGVNGESFYNNLIENKEFADNLTTTQAAEVKKLLDTFNGDLSVGLLNVDLMKQSPAFVAYADVKNGDALKAIYANKAGLGLKPGEEFVQLNENEYVYKTKGMNVFFGVKEKQMYATNDEMTYKNIGKTVEKSIKDTGYASDMKNKSCFFVINVEAILELPIVKMMAGFGGEEYAMYLNLASKVSYFEVEMEGEVGTVNLLLKDKEVNALKQIVDFAKQFAGM